MEPMRGFGGSPFGNDPFFADSGFGNMRSMMEGMNKKMNDMMAMHSEGMDGGFAFSDMTGMGGGRVMKKTMVSSTKMGPDGRPIQESYKTSAVQAVDKNGRKIGERQ